MNEEKSVYEEWRTYPPVPEIKIKDEVFSETNENTKESDKNLSTSKVKIENR